MGARAARLAGAASRRRAGRRGVSFPDLTCPRSAALRCPICAADLPPTQRWPTSRGSASAGRRRCCSRRPTRPISPISSAHLPRDMPGHRHRARLEPAGARRRRARRGHPARARLRQDRGRARPSPARRHRRARRQGRARGGGCRHRRPCLLSRHAGLDRRRAAHECRRAWPRDQGRAGRGARRRPARATIHVLSLADMRLHLSPLRRARRLDLHRGAVPGQRPAIRPRSSKQMEEVAEYREANQPIKERTGGSTFKNPPGHQRLEADRRRRAAAACASAAPRSPRCTATS